MKLERRLYRLEVPFSTSHGRTAEKECIFGFTHYGVWEFTWSPSLGTNAKALHQILSMPADDSASAWVAKNHLSWLNAITEIDTIALDVGSLQGREFSVDCKLMSQPGDEFLRLKCDQVIPVADILRVANDVDIILDFNGSANASLLKESIAQLQASSKIKEIYIEEPFKEGHIPTSWGCRRIFDRRNITTLLRDKILEANDVCTLKLARNSFEEYRQLRDVGCLVSIGQDLATPCGNAITAKLNSRLSNFRLNVITRDNVRLLEDDKKTDMVLLSELLPHLEPHGFLITESDCHSTWMI